MSRCPYPLYPALIYGRCFHFAVGGSERQRVRISQATQQTLQEAIQKSASDEARKNAEERLLHWNDAKDQEIKEIIDR